MNEQMITDSNRYTVAFESKKRNVNIRGCNYPYFTVTMYEEGGNRFVARAFAAYSKGDEMLGNLYASTAERYFMHAELLRKS